MKQYTSEILTFKKINVWLVGLHGISTRDGYLMPNPLETHISNIYDLFGLGFMAYQPLWIIKCQILFILIY